ncbi:hypothetical protein [Thiohalomonas denitrificans]|uniref:Uncharacterized protein n=1 Tax=Thiohalomonas denitrificans TaxID=415747 RepID=A0A1G5R089_9GAMM|nr:hypothetical protein [Thiohalomonas denitrificans]SCZ67515.1 hypothetical protein SAMN03097708_03153 [Thiohalomonas denitrificans]
MVEYAAMIRLKPLLIPAVPRQFPGERWINIALRCLHLVGIAGISGGFLFTLAEAQWLPFWYLTLSSGVALSLLYVWSTALWLVQLKGIAILLKVALLAAATLFPEWRAGLFVSIILISGLIAHAPGAVRGYRLI